MEGRARVRNYLLGREADRAPFLPFATDFTAGLAQVASDELFSDPHLLTQSFLEVLAVCRFDAVLLNLSPQAVAGAARGEPPEQQGALAVVRESVHRLRTLVSERAGIVVVVPGPRTLAAFLGSSGAPGDLDGLGAGLLAAANFVQPQLLDGLGILETEPVPDEDAGELGTALTALWNSARYYSIPSLFVAARAGRPVGTIGAAAVAVWEGATLEELVEEGANRVGVPIAISDWSALPPLPPCGFYTTAGEIPGDADVQWVRDLVARASLVGGSLSSAH